MEGFPEQAFSRHLTPATDQGNPDITPGFKEFRNGMNIEDT